MQTITNRQACKLSDAIVSIYLLGQDGDEDGEGAVEVEECEEEPDPSDHDQAVPVEDDHQHGRHDGEHQQDLTHVQRPALTSTSVNTIVCFETKVVEH